MRTAPALFVLLLAAAPALAQPAAPSNLGMDRYPPPKCAVPPAVDESLRPPRPSDSPNEGEAALYNSKVRAYNAAMRARNDAVRDYVPCINAYIAAGKADIQRIQAAIDAAVAAANGQ